MILETNKKLPKLLYDYIASSIFLYNQRMYIRNKEDGIESIESLRGEKSLVVR